MRVTHSPHPHGDLGLGMILGHTQNLIYEIMTVDMRTVTVDTLHGQISMQHRLQLKHEYVQCHVAIFMAQSTILLIFVKNHTCIIRGSYCMHMYTGLDGTDRAAKINDCACNT